MAEGRSNTSTAAALVVTVGAVEHTRRIFAELGLSPDDARQRRVAAVVRFLMSVRLRPSALPTACR